MHGPIPSFFKLKFKALYKTSAMGVLAGLAVVASHGVKKVSFIHEEQIKKIIFRENIQDLYAYSYTYNRLSVKL